MTNTSIESRGQRVRRLREKKGLRQVDLAARAGLSWRHLIRIEQEAGGVTKPSTLARIADALDVETHEITGTSEDDEEADPVALMAALMKSVSDASAKQAVAAYIAQRETTGARS